MEYKWTSNEHERICLRTEKHKNGHLSMLALLEASDTNSGVSARVGERSSVLEQGLGEMAILRAALWALMGELTVIRKD